ncbi:MAG TPA: ATP-dependent metallopeptidase FtsH/Yme1/Tma family protein, partial [Anaerolineales bacterium]
MNSNRTQSLIIYFLLLVAIGAMLYVGFRQDNSTQQPLTINQVAKAVQDGTVARIIIQNDDTIHIVYKSGKEADSHKETTATLVDQLISLGVSPQQLSSDNLMIEVRPPSQWAGILSSLLYILPVIFMAGVLWFIFRQAQGSNNAAMAFGKSRARMFSGEHPTVTFEDVAGVEESKQELAEVVEFLREPQKFIQLGARIPKGVLLVGPPGT